MSIDLFCSPMAPSTPAIVQLAERLGVKVNKIITDSHKGETRTPEFIKMNPQHCVPTIRDGDFVLWESRVILSYLANTFDKSGKLYPTDPKKRAKVDQMLHFDIGMLYQRMMNHFMLLMKNLPADPEKYKSLEEALALLEGDLGRHAYAAGDDLTIADYAIVVTVGCFDAAGFPLKDYPNVTRWLGRLKSEGVEIPEDVIEGLRSYVSAHKKEHHSKE